MINYQKITDYIKRPNSSYYIMIKQNGLIITELCICSWISSISQLDFNNLPIPVVPTTFTSIIPIHYKLYQITKVILCNWVICEICITGCTIGLQVKIIIFPARYNPNHRQVPISGSLLNITDGYLRTIFPIKLRCGKFIFT